MKVLVVSTNALPAPPPYYGGAELVAFTDALRLAQAGHEVYLLATKGSKSSAVAYLPDMYDDINAIQFFEVGDPMPWGFPASEEQMFNTFMQRVQMFNFDVIIDHSRSRVPSYRLASPSVAIVHDLMPPVPLMSVGKKLCYAGVSMFHMNYLRTLYPDLNNITFVYDHIVEEPLLRIKTTRDKERSIVFVARVDTGKGIIQFLQVCKRLPDVKCYVIGDDMPMLNSAYSVREGIYRVYDYARKLPNVEWLGLVPHDVKYRIMARAMATVVLPTPPYAEVFGLWALESLLLGTPVITTPVGASDEIVKNGLNGFVVSLSAVQDAVAYLVSNGVPVKMTPEEIRWDAFNRFNSRVIAQSLLDLAQRGCG